MKALRIMIPLAVLVAGAIVVAGCGGNAQKGTVDTKAPAGAVSAGKAATSVVKHQEKCPVMGEKVDHKLFVDASGKRIYVCCNECVATVKKDPAKYIKQLEAQGITLDKTPSAN